MYCKYFCVTLCLVAATTRSLYADDCDTALDPALKTEVLVMKSADARQAIIQESCSLDFKEFDAKHGADAKAIFGSISLGGGYSESDYNKFISNMCVKYNKAYSSSSNGYYKLSAVKDSAFAAWTSCKLKSLGLACWAKQLAPSIAQVTISWRPTGLESITLDPISLLNGKLEPVPPREHKEGTSSYNLIRGDIHNVTSLTLNGEGEGKRFSCEVAILPRIGREVKNVNSDNNLMYLQDATCFVQGSAPCGFYVGWANPKPGKQVIIRAGDNNEGYFACGDSNGALKLATWGPAKLSLFEVTDTGPPNHGCTPNMPSGSPSATSSIEFAN